MVVGAESQTVELLSCDACRYYRRTDPTKTCSTCKENMEYKNSSPMQRKRATDAAAAGSKNEKPAAVAGNGGGSNFDGTNCSPSDKTRTLGSGKQALVVSAQGFGCMGITAFYGDPMPDGEAIALLVHAHSKGITHWDTAECYRTEKEDKSYIWNETVIGKAIKAIGMREELTIATKFLPRMHNGRMSSALVINACRNSCHRLCVDYVDLYYLHRFAEGVPIEEQARAMLAAKQSGLAKHIGVSEISPKNLRIFHKICPVTCVQQEWSLMNRDLEDDLVPLCRELGIGIVAYSPLCRKLLSAEVTSASDFGKGDKRSKRYGRLTEENIVANAGLAQKVAAMAKKRGCSAAQLSLAWVANQGPDVVPIPGTTKIPHLDDNVASMKIELSKQEMGNIAALVPASEVMGERYVDGDKLTYKASYQ